MREIKFRAWDKKSNKYRKIDSFSYGGNGHWDTCDQLPKVYSLWGFDIIDDKDVICNRQREEVELEQFIGLYDSTKWEELSYKEKTSFIHSGKKQSEWKGKEIYEGDQVKDEHTGTVGIVMFEEGSFDCGNSFEYKGFVELCIRKRIKVIGNIHENKDILK